MRERNLLEQYSKEINAVPDERNTLTIDDMVTRLKHVKCTKELIDQLIFRADYMGETKFSDRVRSHIEQVKKLDGVLWDQLDHWVNLIHDIQMLFECKYQSELEFLKKSGM